MKFDSEEMLIPRSEAEQKALIAARCRERRNVEEALPGFFTEEFGPWLFDIEDLLLIHQDSDYIIPLEGISSSASILDWIMQVQLKDWCQVHDLYALVLAFKRILDPQAHFCSFEEEQPGNAGHLARQYAERVEKQREELQRFDRIQAQANAILGLLNYDKPMPLSLLLESVSFTREDTLDVLMRLERIDVVRFDRENKYIYLLVIPPLDVPGAAEDTATDDAAA